jgi:ribosomal protein L23
VFIVNRKSDKKKIKEAVKNAFEVDVKSVTTTIDQKGRKKAFIKFKEEGAAGEIAIRLGII